MIIGKYPNTFRLREAIAYFKYLRDNDNPVVDKAYEEIIRSNFETGKEYTDFIERCLRAWKIWLNQSTVINEQT